MLHIFGCNAWRQSELRKGWKQWFFAVEELIGCKFARREESRVRRSRWNVVEAIPRALIIPTGPLQLALLGIEYVQSTVLYNVQGEACGNGTI